MTTTFKQLDIKDLTPDEFNVRKNDWNPNDDDEQKLVDSIKTQGVLEPILVRPIKGQPSKYPKNKVYSIVCGARRYRAAMEARLKQMPAVIRDDLNDVSALGTSIQENLKRRSMDKIVTAKNIGRMWEMLNHGRTYEQKMKEMNESFGMKETAIKSYLNINKLSAEIKGLRADGMDRDTLAGIGSEDDWSKSEKKEAIEILSNVEKSEERRNLLSEIKKKKSEDEDISIEKAVKEIKKEKAELIGETYDVHFNAKERIAIEKAAKKEHLDINTLIKRCAINWLKKEEYL